MRTVDSHGVSPYISTGGSGALPDIIFDASPATITTGHWYCPLPADSLALQPAELLFEIKRVYRLTSGEVAEITFNYYRASIFTFSMRLRWVRGAA